jgi:polar amino acid transport system substrate-binding protein
MLDELPGPINEEQRSQLELVRESGDRLLQVLDRIIHLAAARDEDLDVVHEEVDVCVLAGDVVRALRPLATRKSLDLTFKSSCEDCKTLTDPGHVRSILDNLGSNAIEYTSEGGVTLTVVRSDGWIEIDVADTGRGISRALHERVFEEFGQAEDSDPASPDGGAHIGLALSRQLARKLGGDITLESSPGIGSTFRLRIPVIEP